MTGASLYTKRMVCLFMSKTFYRPPATVFYKGILHEESHTM
jgi:hypothetical protein